MPKDKDNNKAADLGRRVMNQKNLGREFIKQLVRKSPSDPSNPSDEKSSMEVKLGEKTYLVRELG